MQLWTPPLPPDLPVDAHKGIAGRVVMACGSKWMPGAAMLAARAAQRAGAGLVAVLCTDDILRHVVPVAAPEAVLEDAESARFDAGRWHAGLVGPGLGRSAPARKLFERMLSDPDLPLVIDGDALTMLAQSDHRERRGITVLTPHPGEAARLLGREVGSDESARMAAAREISTRRAAICCLKGHRTVVAQGDRVYVNDTGNAGMATAGAGDVLAGISAAWLARVASLAHVDWTPFDAAASAVRVHGRAGDLARDRFGERSLIASDIIDALPHALRT